MNWDKIKLWDHSTVKAHLIWCFLLFQVKWLCPKLNSKLLLYSITELNCCCHRHLLTSTIDLFNSSNQLLAQLSHCKKWICVIYKLMIGFCWIDPGRFILENAENLLLDVLIDKSPFASRIDWFLAKESKEICVCEMEHCFISSANE